MKKKLKTIKLMGILFLVLLLSACESQEMDSEKLNIVTSFYPMYIATANIIDGVEDVELKNLTASTTGCLHDYQLTTANMVTLSRADVLVVNGGGMETFIDKALKTYDSLQVIDAGTEILERVEKKSSVNTEGKESGNHKEDNSKMKNENSDTPVEHEGAGMHKEHEENTHIWVSISLHMEQVEKICDGLMKIDEKNAEAYKKNAQRYLSKLEALKEKMHQALDKAPNKNIITFHEAFAYFADEFNLNVVAVIEREPGTYPSAHDVADIIDLVKEKEIKAIFVEPQYSKSAADTIARETGALVYVLDPIVTGELEKDAYLEKMEENRKALEEALKASV